MNSFSTLHTLFTATVYKVYMLYLAEERLITKLFLITYEQSANSPKLSYCWKIFYKVSFYNIEIVTNSSCNDISFLLKSLRVKKKKKTEISSRERGNGLANCSLMLFAFLT